MPDVPPDRTTNAIAVEATRGGIAESRHRVACAVADASGRLVHRWGDVERPVFPRSALKPIQALPLIETGAADAFGLGDAEIALACASHAGEPMHVETVTAWLARIGLGVDDLECGSHAPSHEASAAALWRSGAAPVATHNNCSGKHTGFLTGARHLGEETRGYVARDHPVQRRVAAVIGEMAGVDMAAAPSGLDGCCIPTFAIPLTALAIAMARFADPSSLPETRRAAIARIRTAMAARPELIAGSGRFCTRLMAETQGRVLAKGGAEGVYALALPALGLGIALKVDDGAGRASEVAAAAALMRIGGLGDADLRSIADLAVTSLINRGGQRVGEVRAVADWPPAGT